MKCVAIIPARGGSKRIPKKNLKDFLGKPIIAYSIQIAIESKVFDEVMVSTDDEEISIVAKRWGAKVPFLRSAKNSDDHATTADVIIEVLDSYKLQGTHFDYACCIYPTAPLLKTSSIIKSFELLREKLYKTVFPVAAFSFPIWRSLKIEDGKVKMIWPEYKHTRSQDLPKAWHDAGQFYWLNVPAFAQEPLLYSSNSGVIELSDLEVQDIDTLDDWKLAEIKVQFST
jgi:N-acylneuraminate cytidylyltransferase